MQLSIVSILAVIGSTYGLPSGSLLDGSLGALDDLVSKAGISITDDVLSKTDSPLSDDWSLGGLDLKVGGDKLGLNLAVHNLGQNVDDLETSANKIQASTSQTGGQITEAVAKNEDLAERLTKITDKVEKLSSASGSGQGSQNKGNTNQKSGGNGNGGNGWARGKPSHASHGQAHQGYKIY
ncbi:hypothetical protein K493DRAFT_67531 [Basidiobolus meristosporus CBS 931.73]|uniref:Uncharacterized protein n=1 Tax=Basidiobolus meristosporus CBS 931.73 TaxID=1314790 RepID=A0A1Y1Z0Y2_9FUNG|nr:hypothetical protein K493DRAFT_67531 [Basidiobolus meristosporus CBS 931.73]|eukprot:ORY03597.1 hypothetical protein K493DRAFT_67531 [Basidiobolus meristosporus CBS 931.73]